MAAQVPLIPVGLEAARRESHEAGMCDVEEAALQRETRLRLAKFNSMRGKEVKPGEFWDVVVITAADRQQELAYQQQIADKLAQKELPLGVRYHVFSDPPGPKIGNGGSTLYALHCLQQTYPRELETFTVLLIHAGGYSQRLPNASALGKIFTALPLGNPIYQMLELKLALYVDFPGNMNPGVVVTCADDIELYSGGDFQVRFDRNGIIALAHPSTLSIGTTHGVFVLDPPGHTYQDLEYRTCASYLHKPSVQKMRQSGAVNTRGDRSGPHLASEVVYTDSLFYMDHGTARLLTGFFQELGDVGCEIDAYGDFLQALGPDATLEYTENTANVSKAESKLIEVRKKIYFLLRGTPFTVIALNKSKFYHVGTMEEYIYHLTDDPVLGAELGFQSSVFSIFPDRDENGRVCVIQSVLDTKTRVSPCSVIEYSRLGPDVSVGKYCIVSNLCINSRSNIPDKTFLSSISLMIDGRPMYATILVSTEDDLKKNVASLADLKSLRIFGRSFLECLEVWGLGSSDRLFSGDEKSLSLWNARIFPGCVTLQKSVEVALEMLRGLHGQPSASVDGVKRLSIEEILAYKDVKDMLNYRKMLSKEIASEGQKEMLDG
ncbi:fucose-1-phosphate guanylyltransferase [Spea bombifrons]|uniref:fucose-1-phosphate guanylyltransferase n=1 Tax=Spea bombifrons TaxID=233779 RepID=UPI00234ACD24|nr:fucose-1-phosphate guanylyltransferase [Spea bombifrons]